MINKILFATLVLCFINALASASEAKQRFRPRHPKPMTKTATRIATAGVITGLGIGVARQKIIKNND